MNTDLLIKLTKLANNNPNENEANLAARKVCRMLEEGGFKLTIEPVSPLTGQHKQAPNPYGPFAEDIFKEFFRGEKTYYDRKRNYTPPIVDTEQKCKLCGAVETLEGRTVIPDYICTKCYVQRRGKV